MTLSEVRSAAQIRVRLGIWRELLSSFLEANCQHCHGIPDGKGDWIRLPDPLYCPWHHHRYEM